MAGYGRQVLGSTGMQLFVSADGAPEWKVGGITIDWSTVAAVSGTDLTLPDLNVIKIGYKGLQGGQIMTPIGIAEVQTITIDATGGTFKVTTSTKDRYGRTVTATSGALAWNISAVDLLAALVALVPAWSGLITVALATLVYTITFNRNLGNITTLVTDPALLTGGGGTAAVATSTSGQNSAGKWGPYDSTATDGRAVLARGSAVILNETVFELDPFSALGNSPTDYVGGIEGGLVYRQRLKITTGSHSLAAGPTVTEFEAAFPRISYAQSL